MIKNMVQILLRNPQCKSEIYFLRILNLGKDLPKVQRIILLTISNLPMMIASKMEGYDQNADFYTLLLTNEEVRARIASVFMSEIYRILRGEDK